MKMTGEPGGHGTEVVMCSAPALLATARQISLRGYVLVWQFAALGEWIQDEELAVPSRRDGKEAPPYPTRFGIHKG